MDRWMNEKIIEVVKVPVVDAVEQPSTACERVRMDR